MGHCADTGSSVCPLIVSCGCFLRAFTSAITSSVCCRSDAPHTRARWFHEWPDSDSRRELAAQPAALPFLELLVRHCIIKHRIRRDHRARDRIQSQQIETKDKTRCSAEFYGFFLCVCVCARAHKVNKLFFNDQGNTVRNFLSLGCSLDSLWWVTVWLVKFTSRASICTMFEEVSWFGLEELWLSWVSIWHPLIRGIHSQVGLS